jgi:hypothetical protein
MGAAAVDAKSDHILGGQLLERGILAAVGHERREIHHDEVGLLAGVERADDSCFAKRAGAAMGAEVKRLGGTQASQICTSMAARMTCHMFNSGPAATSEPKPMEMPAFIN